MIQQWSETEFPESRPCSVLHLMYDTRRSRYERPKSRVHGGGQSIDGAIGSRLRDRGDFGASLLMKPTARTPINSVFTSPHSGLSLLLSESMCSYLRLRTAPLDLSLSWHHFIDYMQCMLWTHVCGMAVREAGGYMHKRCGGLLGEEGCHPISCQDLPKSDTKCCSFVRSMLALSGKAGYSGPAPICRSDTTAARGAVHPSLSFSLIHAVTHALEDA
ncbi:hypothetical protein B0H10DRAFT_633389 [Mycena sp. CBHHK59/15]|nr:hypothetical protein B0H10DRAFT_633389 [Mycena sp. CBHHK59/15]